MKAIHGPRLFFPPLLCDLVGEVNGIDPRDS